MDTTPTAWAVLNGELMERDFARVAVDEAAFLFGESVFTTIRLYAGRPFLLGRHVERMARSLRDPAIAIPYAINPGELARAIDRLVAKSGILDGRLRFTVGRGAPVAGAHPASVADRPAVTTLLTLSPYEPPERWYRQGVRLCSTGARRMRGCPLGRHKTGNYMLSRWARREAEAKGFDEGLIHDQEGHALEGGYTNLFAVVDGTVMTPGAMQGALPGIARELVLHLLPRMGLRYWEGTLSSEQLGRASEIFLTNALIEIAPVARLDDRAILPHPAVQAGEGAGAGVGADVDTATGVAGDTGGLGGPVTRRLRERYREAVGGWLSGGPTPLP